MSSFVGLHDACAGGRGVGGEEWETEVMGNRSSGEKEGGRQGVCTLLLITSVIPCPSYPIISNLYYFFFFYDSYLFFRSLIYQCWALFVITFPLVLRPNLHMVYVIFSA